MPALNRERRRLSPRMLWLACWYATGSSDETLSLPHGRSRRDGTRP